MGILIKPLVCIDHNYVFFNVFTCINNLIESDILYFRKTYDKYATFHLTRYRKFDIEISD